MSKNAKNPPLRTKEEQRSYTMSRIKSKNTSIEISFRKALWHAGVRYRKNYRALPGAPDIAITKHKIAIFCDGEFWHGKDWETVKPKLQANREYWIAKIERNMCRDDANDRQLQLLGWTVMRFWGGDIRKKLGECVEDVREAIFHARIDACGIAAEIPDIRAPAALGSGEPEAASQD
jgi:DNA mismatch endonuclease (patch repair protein)